MCKENDFQNLLEEEVKIYAQSHVRAYKERYRNKFDNANSKEEFLEDIEFDLKNNHDPSLEVEKAEEWLGRKLEYGEYDKFVEEFNEAVLRKIKNEFI